MDTNINFHLFSISNSLTFAQRCTLALPPPPKKKKKIAIHAIEASELFFIKNIFNKISVYTADLYYTHDSWRSRACLPVEAVASDRSVPMVTNPRYSCHSAPKQVCWWHHQICHLPRRPCSLSRRQPAEWGHQLALRSLCLRYSRLPMSMFALLSPSSASSTSPLPSCSNLFYSKGFNCIPALLWAPAVSRVSSVVFFFLYVLLAQSRNVSLISVSALLFCAWSVFFF